MNTTQSDIDDDTTSDASSDYNINIVKIISELEKLDNDISNINNNIPIEDLIDVYLKFKMRINYLKTLNNNFKLSIEYL